MDSDNQEISYSEAVFCDRCDKLIEIILKCSHLKALSFEEFDRFKHEKITIKNPDIKKINKIIDTFINEYDKKYDFYLIKYNFKLVFSNPQHVMNIETSPHTSRITLSSGYLLNDAITDIDNQGYTFDRINEFNILTIADKMDMTYDFYFKHNMFAFEWKLNAMINKNKSLINKLDRKKIILFLESFLMSHLEINKCLC